MRVRMAASQQSTVPDGVAHAAPEASNSAQQVLLWRGHDALWHFLLQNLAVRHRPHAKRQVPRGPFVAKQFWQIGPKPDVTMRVSCGS